jgi:nitroreductase
MEFWDLLKLRKSIRSFDISRNVSRESIEKVIEAATYAPSSCNQQLWNFILVTDINTKERLIKEAASNTMFRRTPVLICVTYDSWNYKEAIQGASLAVGNLLLAASDIGLGSLPMNSYGADTGIKKVLKIPDRETICCFVALGYPDEKAEKATSVSRRPVGEVIHWENFNTAKNYVPFTYNPNDWSIDNIKNHQQYYCRKTSSGKEMDICNNLERQLVSKVMKNAPGPMADLLSYDGSYLREFPKIEITTFDLSSETRDYTQSATTSAGLEGIEHKLLSEDLPKVKTVSMFYKLERIPNGYARELFDRGYNALEDNGEMIIISRKSNLLLWFFFMVIKMLFGKELRKTGIYNFFGPYRLISLNKTIQMLRDAGFKKITWQGHFLFPVFYEQLYQMYLQYRISEGSSFLHREKRVNFITKIISKIINIQGLKHFGRFGSVVVIKCQK